MKNFFKVIFSRAVFTGVFIALQFAAIFLAVTRFNEHFALFYGICLVLSAIVVIYLVGRDGNPAYKIAWIIPILALPVFGVLLYLVFGKNQLSPKEKARMSSVSEQYEKAMRSVTAAEPGLPPRRYSRTRRRRIFRSARRILKLFWRSWKKRKSSFLWNTTSLRPGRCGTPYTMFCAARRKTAWMCA